jgi:hypothetical protein
MPYRGQISHGQSHRSRSTLAQSVTHGWVIVLSHQSLTDRGPAIAGQGDSTRDRRQTRSVAVRQAGDVGKIQPSLGVGALKRRDLVCLKVSIPSREHPSSTRLTRTEGVFGTHIRTTRRPTRHSSADHRARSARGPGRQSQCMLGQQQQHLLAGLAVPDVAQRHRHVSEVQSLAHFL